MFRRLLDFIKPFFSTKYKTNSFMDEIISKPTVKDIPKVIEIAPSSLPPLPIIPEILEALFPINIIDKEKRINYIQDNETLSLGRGTLLFMQGEPINSLYYLLEGTVSLYIYDDKVCEISPTVTVDRFPLCSGKTYSVSARAETDIQVVRVSPDVMLVNQSKDISPFNPTDPNIPKNVQESRLFQTFCQVYLNGRMQIPPLPSMTLKLRQALQAEDVGIREVAEIVQMDSVIAGRLIQIANSVLYRPWAPFNNCRDAIAHIGLIATRNFVVMQSMRQIFNSKNFLINRLLREEWRKSVYLSSLCWVLASENGGVHPEEAQLAGLVSDIGKIPFINSLANIKNEHLTPNEIALVLPYICPKIGAEVLKSWGFSNELAEIPLLSENWFNDTNPQIRLSDIVILSKLHAYIGSPKMKYLPPINSIPAFGKLKDYRLCLDDPITFSLQVLHSAKEKVSAAEGLLGF